MPQFWLPAWQKPQVPPLLEVVDNAFVQLPRVPSLDQPRLHGQMAPGVSNAPAVVGPDTDVVPGNHCWQ